jgi:hypothetical protein
MDPLETATWRGSLPQAVPAIARTGSTAAALGDLAVFQTQRDQSPQRGYLLIGSLEFQA